MMNASELIEYSSVVRRVHGAPHLYAVQQALIRQPLWDAALLHAQVQALGVVDGADSEVLATALRQLRSAAVDALAHLDASQTTSLEVITGNMTVLADFALHTLLRDIGAELAKKYGMPCDELANAIDVQVVAMGKHGGCELNISSDIDIVFLCRDMTGDTAGVLVQGLKRTLSNSEFFNQWARRCVQLMNAVTADGFVFRVDTMLRPHGSAGPLVLAHDSLENYLLTQGRMWERLAWLKARPVLTPVFESEAAHRQGHALWQAVVLPFVYRRYLDFTVIDALRDLHAQIRAQRRQFEVKPHIGLHVKLSRGGIREIEFWTQGQQLIRGGKNPSLRVNATLPALQALATAGDIDPSTAQALAAHYTLLRRAEHAVQYVDDAQTHTLPADDAQRSAVAQYLNFASLADLDQALASGMAFVAQQFDALFADAAAPALNDPVKHALESAAELALTPWLDKVKDLPVHDDTRLALEAVLKQLDGKDEVGFARAAAFILSISKRKTYIHLLRQYPPALVRLQSMMSASVFATKYIQEHPALIDELIDATSLYQPMTTDFWQTERNRLMTRLQGLDDESQMHVLREVHHAWVLKILAQDLVGQIDVRGVSDALSAAADMALDAALCCVHAKMVGAFKLPDGLGVIAYGKLGGKELGYGSDLDLVFVFDAALAGQAGSVYPRLVQRLVSWLGVQTPAGRLFEIDTALRPDGQAGLLLSSMTAFAQYQLGQTASTHAWLWEHQAISRARVCAGDPMLHAPFEALRQQVLQSPRDDAVIKPEIAAMRQRIRLAHPVPSEYFDPKHSLGGMVDIEFAVQYLVLRHAAACPALLANVGNVALLHLAADHGYLTVELAESVGQAYMALRTAAHRSKLAGDERAWVLQNTEQALRLQALSQPVHALSVALGLVQ